MKMNLRTGELSIDEPSGGDWIVVDSARATVRQLTEQKVSVYDRHSTLGKELSFRRAQRGIKDGLSALSRNGNPKYGRGAHKQDIDVGLAVLCAVKPDDTEFSQADIAEVCGCSRETIRKIEASAINKLRNNPAAKMVFQEVFA